MDTSKVKFEYFYKDPLPTTANEADTQKQAGGLPALDSGVGGAAAAKGKDALVVCCHNWFIRGKILMRLRL
jgi:hypothetical protein